MAPVKSAKTKAAEEAVEPDNTVRVFEYCGAEYTIDWKLMSDSLDVAEAIEDEKWIKTLRLLLGPVQWSRFKSTQPGGEDVGKFIELIFEVPPGE